MRQQMLELKMALDEVDKLLLDEVTPAKSDSPWPHDRTLTSGARLPRGGSMCQCQEGQIMYDIGDNPSCTNCGDQWA